MTDDLKSKKSTTDFFNVWVEGEKPLIQDIKRFDVNDERVDISVQEGAGGNMETKRLLKLGFQGNCPNGRHDATSLLEVDYRQWSDMHGIEYRAKSGWVEVRSTSSPRCIAGEFEMVVSMHSSSPPVPPSDIKVSGEFNLTSD